MNSSTLITMAIGSESVLRIITPCVKLVIGWMYGFLLKSSNSLYFICIIFLAIVIYSFNYTYSIRHWACIGEEACSQWDQHPCKS